MVAGDGKVPIFGKIKKDYPFFMRGDLDAFPALFFDNLSSLLGILFAMIFVPVLASIILGDGRISGAHIGAFTDMIFGRMAPGIAIALAFGNVCYSWMAWKLAYYEDRDDVTALPYGINTPAGFVMAFQVMLPLCFAYADSAPEEFALKVWQGACSANFVGGLFEISGFWLGNIIRDNSSKAALYAPIAAVGFVYLAYVPFVAVNSEPIIGILPFALAFTGFFANGGKGIYIRGISSVLVFGVGVILKWAGAGKYDGTQEQQVATIVDAFYSFAGKNSILPGVSLLGFGDVGNFIGVVFPVALQSFIETMENVEAAAEKGDHYNVMEAMIVDGVGTCIGSVFGSVIPTTVYIGHARHKIIGARASYSLLNAATYFVLLMAGIFPVLFYFVDPISVGCILIFVGLMIVQQSFDVSAPRHYPCLCVGLFCLIADQSRLNGDTRIGVINLGAGGGIMASLIITQIICDLTDCRFDRAALYSLIACVFSEFGIMHGNNPVGINGGSVGLGELAVSYSDGATYESGLNEGWRFAVAYAMLTVFCVGHWVMQKFGRFPEAVKDNGVVEKPAEGKETEV